MSGFTNFLKVAIQAITKPSKLLIMAVGIGVSIFFPALTLIILPIALLSVLVSSWADINDPEFIKSVLQQDSTLINGITIRDIINNISNLEKKDFTNEVKEDLSSVKTILLKIDSAFQKFSDIDASQLTFIKEYISKICQRLVSMANKEELAREYLSREDRNTIETEIKTFENKLLKTKDKLTKREYQKTIELKKEQLALLDGVNLKLERIDSYISRIKSTLENTYANITKFSLKDDINAFDDGEVLTESLKQIVDDIDKYEENTIDIDEEILTVSHKDKTITKNSLTS